MKLTGRGVAITAGVLLLPMAALCGWLYFYTADLPSIAELDRDNPETASEIRAETTSPAHVVPSDLFGKHLFDASVAAKGRPEGGPVRAV